ncbi:MAG TPA: lysine--tRNA ligase [Candidatus Saccharimonadales bacterium]|nr:lysine--tRNA ligase [Candidatus Saccharimonadales bacterium]
MATLKELRDERLRKLNELTQLGVNPYPAKAERTHTLRAVNEQFAKLEGAQASVVGRITNIRKFGKIAFVVIRDATGSLQLFLGADKVADLNAEDSQIGFDQLPLLDSGDFIQADGQIIKTKTGEISIGVERLRLLTKSLRPLPGAHDGFTNKEERLRRRYVDTNANPDVYERFLRRSAFWQATRDFLLSAEFVEINTPVLELTTGGADANPFVTHMDALNQDFYLRISHELPLKRLLVGGYEKVFDIGPRFRNENYSDEHLPEHIAMEWYWAYADWNMGMRLTEQLVRSIADKTWGTRQFTLANGMQVDLGADGEDWPRISFVNIMQEHFGLNVFTCTLDEVKAQLKKYGVEVEKSENRPRGIDKLWKKIRGTLPGPAFLVDIPTFLQPLAKTQASNPELTEQFNLLLGGSELCKAYSELNDPIDQLNRFVEQQAMRDAGDDEAMMLDIDYVEALEYAMPPACGFGFSERLFWVLEGVTAREGVIFPALRREIDETTKTVYPDLKFEAPAPKPAPKASAKDLPESAAEQGTVKLYLDNYQLTECNATLVSTEDLGEGSYRFVLDQTCLYPGGGGQDFDLGKLEWDGGELVLTSVSKDKDGIVYHDGTLQGELPKPGDRIECEVDEPRRLLNSRLHCAGHLIDYAIAKLGKDWKAGKGAHYPGRSYVEYDGEYVAEESETLARSIETVLQNLVQEGGAITPSRVPGADANKYSAYLPQTILDSYKNVHVTKYPHDFAVCCGGTHLKDVSELGEVKITKIKKKDGHIRVSYELVS